MTPDDMTLADLWNPAEAGQPSFDEVHEYAQQAATEIIRSTRFELPVGASEREIAECVSADQVEAASFANFESAPGFELDPSLLHLLIETALCAKLGVLPSVISSQY